MPVSRVNSEQMAYDQPPLAPILHVGMHVLFSVTNWKGHVRFARGEIVEIDVKPNREEHVAEALADVLSTDGGVGDALTPCDGPKQPSTEEALDYTSDDVQDKVAGLEQPSSRSDVVYRIRSLREEDADDATVHEVTLEQLRLVPRIGQADESTVLLLKEHKVGVSPPVGRLVHLACATRACPQCSVWAVLTEAVVSATYDSVYGEW
eukprot:m.928262 g.928262  ORF g.928262 m.928262 type:complete len:207 (+) comp23775_c0_seq37:4483-5103(+)